MNTASLSVQKARALANSLRTNRSAGRGWDGRADRDLVREANELYFLAQASLPRHI
ncbi:hypothetical protein G7075_17860 [Phycicoccus sp. HDW14]|uniref:hypothetical protein n=1 Tax=Phycicoccus sp. HDW14 TaxID=2714941 RepID=UPI0014096E32|nr:hypothetical protein [Phycicoccus sp. HDW14]QIM22563.1 hypothetical protein G7075_17860 [Phycicoccus sp. HDW14]